MTEVIAWSDAAAIAGQLVPPGPVATRAELDELVASLRRAADRAVGPVVDITEMLPTDGRDLTIEPLSGVRVVDRASWARASAKSIQAMTTNAAGAGNGQLPRTAELTSSAELGGLLALLSTKILGQFDPFANRSANLLLVAPNVLQTERQLQVTPADFRLWVCLHEQTHALQLAAAPWIADHISGHARDLVNAASSPATLGQAATTATTVLRAIYAAALDRPGPSLVDGLLTGPRQEIFAELTALMSVLEGHADVAMDAVGPSIVPSVRAIRRKFTARRQNRTARAKMLGRLLGMELKLAQYRDGAAFVRAVTSKVGTSGFNAVWTGPENLPTLREIADPIAWVRRVHG